MKTALLSVGIALALAAGLPALANAQRAGGHGSAGGGAAIAGGGGGGGVRAGGGGGAAFAPSAPSGSVARGPTSRGAFASTPSGGPRVVQGGVTPGGQRFVQGGGNWRPGFRHGRRVFRGGPVFGFYGYDGPYYDYAYADDCYQLRLIRGVWHRVYVCETGEY